MFQNYPPAKLQISQNGISRQESLLSILVFGQTRRVYPRLDLINIDD